MQVRYVVSPVAGSLVGAGVQLRKAAVIFVLSVRPSVRIEQLSFHWTDILEI